MLNVAGHRLSTIEIGAAQEPSICCRGSSCYRPHEVKGEAISVFVTLKSGEPGEALKKELRQHVRQQIGAIASPDDVHYASLPKTRAARSCDVFCDIAAGRETVGDTTTLEDYTVLESS